MLIIVQLLDNYLVPDPNWNHIDFQLSQTQGKYVNARIIKTLKLYDNNQ